MNQLIVYFFNFNQIQDNQWGIRYVYKKEEIMSNNSFSCDVNWNINYMLSVGCI